MKIILIGDAKTGKTSYIQQLVYDKFREYYEPTYGCLIYVFYINMLGMFDHATMRFYKTLYRYYCSDQGTHFLVDNIHNPTNLLENS